MTIRNDRSRPTTPGSHVSRSPSKRSLSRGRRKVAFALKEEVAHFDEDKLHRGGSAYTKGANNDRNCQVTHLGGVGAKATYAVSWPNGQRFEGRLDGMGSPHGEGTLHLPGHPPAASVWAHGKCAQVAGHAEVPDAVQLFRAPRAGAQSGAAGLQAPRGRGAGRMVQSRRAGPDDAAVADGKGDKASSGSKLGSSLKRLFGRKKGE